MLHQASSPVQSREGNKKQAGYQTYPPYNFGNSTTLLLLSLNNQMYNLYNII